MRAGKLWLADVDGPACCKFVTRLLIAVSAERRALQPLMKWDDRIDPERLTRARCSPFWNLKNGSGEISRLP
jgi:hypothetical protein